MAELLKIDNVKVFTILNNEMIKCDLYKLNIDNNKIVNIVVNAEKNYYYIDLIQLYKDNYMIKQLKNKKYFKKYEQLVKNILKKK